MTYYAPCKNCLVDSTTCARRASVRGAIAGMNITSLKFKCLDRMPLFRAGQRVNVEFESRDEFDCFEHVWPGTVIRESGSRFIVKVDNVEDGNGELLASHYIKNESLYCKVSPTRLSPLTEPDRDICNLCDSPRDGHEENCFLGSDYSPARRPCFKAEAAQ